MTSRRAKAGVFDRLFEELRVDVRGSFFMKLAADMMNAPAKLIDSPMSVSM